MKTCRKCDGRGYLLAHRNKPLRICKKCDGWGKTEDTKCVKISNDKQVRGEQL